MSSAAIEDRSNSLTLAVDARSVLILEDFAPVDVTDHLYIALEAIDSQIQQITVLPVAPELVSGYQNLVH